ncbi:hypothetical protein FZEAL_5779 [Fusarium zealandicum]|uniref:DDHD domain-containing protein n=1 Tax=Fusarium zealandicum TaxID=1053134 RepID=A0A8H4UJG1_9HYPO|nr:hypothetical protein FZEAL_5779 [Fusarium zealandicum]
MSLCKACEEELVLHLDPEDDVDEEAGASGAGPSTASTSVPDDLELPCGCHFHWQCLLDQSSDVALSLKCPNCSTQLPANDVGPSVTNQFLATPPGAAILTKYTNEGGVQENLDILPAITEEAYLESNPEARPARALHLMCAEGDLGGIVELLRDASDEIGDLASFIKYQDPLADMKSGLHLAIEHSQEESLWLLLWLCSTVPDSAFPEAARSLAQALAVGRLSVPAEEDIRGLQDTQGRTAADLAQQLQGPWASILGTGLLSMREFCVAPYLELARYAAQQAHLAQQLPHFNTTLPHRHRPQVLGVFWLFCKLPLKKYIALAILSIQRRPLSGVPRSLKPALLLTDRFLRGTWSRSFSATMASGAADKKNERSYLGSAVDSINPWANSRSTTPTHKAKPEENQQTGAPVNPEDHSTTHLYGQSPRTYPPGCPPLNVQWFHAVDAPKRKPQLASSGRSSQPEQPLLPPKKYSAFSLPDSKALEAEYQKLLQAMEGTRNRSPGNKRLPSRKRKVDATDDMAERPLGKEDLPTDSVRVPVNEDFLFDVDIEARELAPVYWLGPVYDVRRGTWFYQEGSTLRPCEENLAAQLEEGYLKTKPWQYVGRERSSSVARNNLTPKASREDLGSNMSSSSDNDGVHNDSKAPSSTPTAQTEPKSYRLFGTHMNTMVTYQDANTAWLSSESMLSWVTSSVYQRFAGGSYMSGVKLIRGHSEPSKNRDKDKDQNKEKSSDSEQVTTEDALSLDEEQQKLLKRRSAPPATRASYDESSRDNEQNNSDRDPREIRLQRQLSSLIESEGRSRAETAEEIRRREEQEIQDDYNAQAGETQGRDIEHLVLVTHGIGQLLSLRMESVNFVHDVNVLRKTVKSVYANSEDLKALNSELGPGPGNCRVQVLPVCWRHLLEFPRKREKKGERDLGEVDDDEDEYPSLEDITIEGMAFARSLISDLALDVLLYQSSYREQIARIVLNECNRIFQLFKERNPDFNGKVHLMGHSLGSAILFDVLCQQQQVQANDQQKSLLRLWPMQDRPEPTSKDSELVLDFNVEDFFCLGSPVGLFQMLKGRTIAARQISQAVNTNDSQDLGIGEDVLRTTPLASGADQLSPVTGRPASVSSPKVQQLFNIFHPSDPISYRLEPLISPSMSSLKPQLLPYTKRGLFGNVAPQGLTGIGTRVGQSVSGLWSSLSAGIASNLLNRSLGLSNEEVARLTAKVSQGEPQGPAAAGSKTTATGEISDAAEQRDAADARKRELADSAMGKTESEPGVSPHNPILIDDEMETLYSKFQQSRAELAKDGEVSSMLDEDRKARKMRNEESKVRALNRNGRVDYSIQESVLDFNPINTIASHMGYWADEDVNHFVLSQLLSNRSGHTLIALEVRYLGIGPYDIAEAICKQRKPKVQREDLSIDGDRIIVRVRDISDPGAKKTATRSKTADDNGDMLLRANFLRRALPAVPISGYSDATRAIIQTSEQNTHTVLIEGYGLRACITTEGVIGTKTRSNNVMECRDVLGIEAARTTIADEIGEVMGDMGIDPRHMQLPADVMTYKGKVLGITRFGLSKIRDSLLQLASFEKTPDHLFESAAGMKTDQIEGVRECIIMGQTMSVGTGAFQVVRRLGMRAGDLKQKLTTFEDAWTAELALKRKGRRKV